MAVNDPVYSEEVRSHTQRELLYYAKCTLSGDYATGGIPARLIGGVRVNSSKPPLLPANFKGKSGYVYEHDLANDKLIIRQEGAAAAPAPELSAAALPAGVTNDVIRVEVRYPKFG